MIHYSTIFSQIRPVLFNCVNLMLGLNMRVLNSRSLP